MMVPCTRRRLNSSTSSNDEELRSTSTLLHRIESEDDDGKSDDEEEEEEEEEDDCGCGKSLQDDTNDESGKAISRGGVVTPFPWKLHDMLEDADEENREHIVSWQAHGRSFMVHHSKDFVSQIMKKYFNQSKFASFQRQLNLYGFRRLTHGRDKGAYWHECFIRGQRSLCKGMIRQKIKGTKVRKTLAPHEEPDFYKQEWALSKKQQQQQQQQQQQHQHKSALVSKSSTRTESNHKEQQQQQQQQQSSLPLPLVSPTVERSIVQVQIHTATTSQQTSNSGESVPAIIASSSSSSLEDMVEDPCEQLIPISDTTSMVIPDTTGSNQHDNMNVGITMSNNNNNNKINMQHVKGGDLLFFEGRPFHYLEHLEGLPAPTPSSSTMSLAAVFCQPQPSPMQQPQQQQQLPPSHLVGSLGRMEPDRLLSYNMCTV